MNFRSSKTAFFLFIRNFKRPHPYCGSVFPHPKVLLFEYNCIYLCFLKFYFDEMLCFLLLSRSPLHKNVSREPNYYNTLFRFDLR